MKCHLANCNMNSPHGLRLSTQVLPRLALPWSALDEGGPNGPYPLLQSYWLLTFWEVGGTAFSCISTSEPSSQ